MNKKFFLDTDDQRALIAKHNLKCDLEVGQTTYITKHTPWVEDTSPVMHYTKCWAYDHRDVTHTGRGLDQGMG